MKAKANMVRLNAKFPRALAERTDAHKKRTGWTIIAIHRMALERYLDEEDRKFAERQQLPVGASS